MQMNRVQFEKLGKSIETDMERPFTGNKLEKPELHLADTNDIPIIHKARISAAKSEQGATVVAAGVEQRSLTNAARTPHREQPPGAMVQSKSAQNSLSDNTTSSDPTIAEFSMQPSRVEAATTVAAREQQEMEMPSIVIELDTTGTEEGELSAAALGCVSDGAEVVATAGAERLGIAHEHNGPRGDAPSIVFVHGDVPGFAKGRAGAGSGEREHGLEQPPGLSVLLVHDSRGEDDREATRAEPDPATDQQRRPQNQGATRKRTKSNAKMKLVRSLAVCDDPSPPPASDAGVQDNQEPHAGGREEESVLRDKDRGSERATAERQEKMPKVPRILSRDSSQEYTDSTGVDVHEFLVNTLKNNPRDRMMLLKMEQELMEFVQDNKQHYRKFPPMTSYHRMLVHRVAAYFGMDHNVDQTGKAVVVNRTPGTRIPEQRFSVHLKDEARAEESQKRFILKRDNSSMDRDDMQRIRPLQDERRSKSFEEREEEYQRVRDRIFAQDSLSSQELPQIEIRIQEDGCSSNNTLKRRQIFSRGKKDSGRLTNGSGQGGSGESELRPAEPRPWSSTDLESSGFRLARPAITKASSFGGISVLARGDSCSGGGKSNAGRLSKTGSETSSSGGSLSGSQARPPHPSSSGGPQGPHSSGGTGGGGSLGAPVGAPGGPNYYLLSLDNAGIPPGSVLINPQTGQPLLNTDGTLAVYNPPNGGQQHQHQQPMGNHLGGPPPSHQPMGGHMVAPPNQQPPQQQAHSSGGMMTQPGQYSVVSYPPPAAAPTHLPTSPQTLMPVLSAQQSYPVPEELGPHFSQLSLGQPTAGDASEPSHAHVYHAIVPQNSAQPPTYLGQHLQPGGFPPPSAAANSATQQHQQQQQQQAYGQSQPHGQMPIYFCPPAQYQPSSQQYRAVAPVQYGTPRGQQPGYQPVGPSYGPIQPPHSQGLMGGQQGTVGSPAQGPMGNTMQGVMVQYTPMTSYHMSQSGPQAPPPPAPPPQQSYQPPVLMGGGQQLYCNVGPPPPPPPPPNSMSGSGVSYLHPPSMEQLQFRTPSPAGSQPTQGQHYATGLSPSGHGVFVMQLSLPSSPHPPRTAASPTRWGQRRGLSLDQRLPRTSEHGRTEGINQVSPRLSSPMASPVQSPNSSPMAALGSIRPGLLPLPLVQSRPIAPKQGDGRYPLAGPAVQYGPQTCGLQPPHPHMAVSLQQVKTGGRGKRHPRKALSEDTSSVEQGAVSDMCSPGDRGYPRPDLIPPASATLEVLDLPHGISRVEADALLGKLAAAGGEIHWLQDARMEQGQAAAASSLAGCSAGRYNAKLGSTVDTEKHTPGSNGEQKSHWDVRREVPVVATSRIDVASGPKAHLEVSCPSDGGHAEAKTQLRDFSPTVGTNPRGLAECDGGSGAAFPNPASERGNGSSALRQDLASHYKVVAVFPTRQLAQSALAKLGHGTGSGFRLRPIRRRYEAHTLERASSH